jgi:hypothetical protein
MGGEDKLVTFQDLPNMERIIIPDGCTDKNQSLDLIVFRQ